MMRDVSWIGGRDTLGKNRTALTFEREFVLDSIVQRWFPQFSRTAQCTTSGLHGNLPKTQIDLNRSRTECDETAS
jgi:hypothetical protein